MKGNAKKFVVFVIMAAIAMLMAVPTASANDLWWRMLIRGEYAFTGSGACTLAPGGFNDHFLPNDPLNATMGPNFWEGVYTFNFNGTGKMEALQRYQDGPPYYGAGSAKISWGFDYAMNGNEITFTFIPGTYYGEYLEGPNKGQPPLTTAYFDNPWTGRISPDGRNLFVFYGVPMKIIIVPNFFEIVCNAVHQGVKTP